jgi:hypothetical protein
MAHKLQPSLVRDDLRQNTLVPAEQKPAQRNEGREGVEVFGVARPRLTGLDAFLRPDGLGLAEEVHGDCGGALEGAEEGMDRKI